MPCFGQPGKFRRVVESDSDNVCGGSGGNCSILVEGKEAERHARVGKRRDLLAGSPEALILPRRTRYTITTSDSVEIAIVLAPSDKDGAPDRRVGEIGCN